MSLLWRKNWTSGPKVLPFMVKADTGLAQKCSCCPCEPTNWYIATVCPCPDCGESGPYFIGLTQSVGEEVAYVEYPPDAIQYQIRALALTAQDPYDSANPPLPTIPAGKVSEWDCRLEPLNAILLAVKHTSNPAPFAGTITAQLYINGAAEGGPWSDSCAETEEVPIGDGVSGESVATELLEVNRKFDEVGQYDVDLVVTFSAAGQADVSYSCRTSIRVVELGAFTEENPWIGAVGVVPEFIDIETGLCMVESVHPDYPAAKMAMRFELLKGPFDKKAEAEYVLNRWTDEIAAYADGCVCGVECPYKYFGVDQFTGPVDGWYYVEEYGSTGDHPSGPYSCMYGFMEWKDWTVTISADLPATVQKWWDDGRGNISYDTLSVGVNNLGSGILPPCKGGGGIRFQLTDQEFDTELIKHNGLLTIGGTDGPVENPNPCAFCSNDDWEDEDPPAHCLYHLSDNEGEWFSDWDYTARKDGGPYGIPNNTAEYLDYTGEVLIASVTKQLLSEMPEDMA